MAGVTGSNEMSAQYSVRGGSYDENSVYINGIEVYRPQLITSGQQEGLSIINPDLVGSIGFSTGGFPAEYGDKMSSVLDITYRQPQSFEGSLSASLMGGSLTIGQASGKFSQLHGIRYKRNSSLLGSMDTKGEYNPAFFDYQTSLTWQFSKNSKHPSSATSVSTNINSHLRTAPPPSERQPMQRNSPSTSTVMKKTASTPTSEPSLEYRINRGTNLQLLASGYLTDELVAYDISGEYWLDRRAGTSDVGGELGVGRYHEHARNRLKASVLSLALKGQSALNPRHTLTYGISLQSEKSWTAAANGSCATLPASHFQPQARNSVWSTTSTPATTSAPHASRPSAQDAWKLSTSAGFLTVNAGLRLSYWSFNRELLLSPRLNIGFIPDKAPSWAIRFSTGLYYQSPFYKRIPHAGHR